MVRKEASLKVRSMSTICPWLTNHNYLIAGGVGGGFKAGKVGGKKGFAAGGFGKLGGKAAAGGAVGGIKKGNN